MNATTICTLAALAAPIAAQAVNLGGGCMPSAYPSPAAYTPVSQYGVVYIGSPNQLDWYWASLPQTIGAIPLPASFGCSCSTFLDPATAVQPGLLPNGLQGFLVPPAVVGSGLVIRLQGWRYATPPLPPNAPAACNHGGPPFWLTDSWEIVL